MAKRRILVVEDEIVVAMDIQDLLKNLGYDAPVTAPSGEEAIKRTEEIKPDLVLMDIVLRGDMDGIEAADYIRTRFDIPVVYLTAYADEKTLQRAKVTVPFGYLLKPFDGRMLHTSIEIALYKHTLDKALRESEERYRVLSEQLEVIVEQRTRELQDAQEQLIRKEKLAVLGQLAGSVGHDLRNPLGVISNAVYFLKMTLADADEVTREYLEMIAAEVRNAEGIISDLLDFSRTRVAEREDTEVSELIDLILEKQPPPEKVTVSLEIASDLPPVFIDPRQVERVLVNLITNAYQAMPEGGTLSISAHMEVGKVSLAVTDTGCGISEEHIEKLFEPLFTTRMRGIGLGLAIAKNLVEANGGSISVESEEGKGSTFTVSLPIGKVVS